VIDGQGADHALVCRGAPFIDQQGTPVLWLPTGSPRRTKGSSRPPRTPSIAVDTLAASTDPTIHASAQSLPTVRQNRAPKRCADSKAQHRRGSPASRPQAGAIQEGVSARVPA